jgi:hypothetical protein
VLCGIQLLERGSGDEMFQSQKNVFWEALLITLFVFGIGVILGVIIENWRTNQIDSLYQQADVELLDMKLQNELYAQGNFNCSSAILENNNFADKIYEEAKILDNYERANKLTDKILLQHKKYDILRSMIFLNSLEIQKTCKSSYNTVLYFYKYNNPRLDLRAKQDVFSRLLGELKQKQGSNILLIPMAADNDISSINTLLNIYNISISELPVVLINGKIKLTDIGNINQLESYFS